VQTVQRLSQGLQLFPKMDPVKPAQYCSANAAFGDMYPERRGPGVSFSVFETMIGKAKVNSVKDICQKNVLDCLEMPMIRLMISALESSGCKADLSRHFSCEMCTQGRECQNMGGYDDETNQETICDFSFLFIAHKY
jgi:hypothetical protein